LWYQLNKSAVKIVSQRDFLEKKVKFSKDGKKYVFFSSVPDEFRPPNEGTTRAYTISGFHVFEKLEDGRVKYTSYS